MPPRPAGTDGTDHSYRMVIVDRYKRMAQYKDAIEKLMASHVVFGLLKLAWFMTAFSAGGVPLPVPSLSIVAGQVVVLALYYASKLGTAKESLPLLKTYNLMQSVVTATIVMSGWIYHNGTNTGGEPTYEYAHTMARQAARLLPSSSPELLLNGCKAAEVFLDASLAAFLVMATFVAHKMIVEKMAMKKEKQTLATDRKGAVLQRGDSDSSDDASDDDDGVPQAAPLQAEAPRVVKAAATSKTQAARRRHA